MVFVVVFFLAAALLVLVVRLLFPLATSVVARLVERRFLVPRLPEGSAADRGWRITDRYITDTHLRLRRMEPIHGGPHPGSSPCGFLDGSVRSLRYGLPFKTLASLWAYNDGIVISGLDQ